MWLSAFCSWLVVFARVGTMLGLMPMFSPQNFPVQLRVALSGLLAVLLAPFVAVPPVEGLSVWKLMHLMMIEVGVGLLLGFVCRLVFLGLDAAGTVIATEMGLINTSEFNQLSNAQEALPGLILSWLALMLWFGLDLHHWMIAALQRSYTLLPAGSAHLSEALLQDMIHRSAGVFAVALQMGAPIIGVSFIISLVLSMLGRAVPQMNVFAESFPIRTLVGLVIFGSTSTFLGQHIVNYLRRLPEDTLRVAHLLTTG